jgi:Amidohydrolase family
MLNSLTCCVSVLTQTRKAGISHCPNSNFTLNSGILCVRDLWKKGIKVGLGTDGSGGYSFSMLNSIRSAITASSALNIRDPACMYITYVVCCLRSFQQTNALHTLHQQHNTRTHTYAHAHTYTHTHTHTHTTTHTHTHIHTHTHTHTHTRTSVCHPLILAILFFSVSRCTLCKRRPLGWPHWAAQHWCACRMSWAILSVASSSTLFW